MPYIFAHFREKITIDGEQVYFSVSKDGYNWEQINGGKPVLTAQKGEKGSRDIEIARLKDGSFVILTTDLLIAARMDENLSVNWDEVSHNGSRCLRMWRSRNLIDFSEETMIDFSRCDFGCMWAPEIFYDNINDEFLVHWSSNSPGINGGRTSIFCCTTTDFERFSEPKLFFGKKNDVIDSHIFSSGGKYHLFYKNCAEPLAVYHAVSDNLYGPYENDDDFLRTMLSLYRPGSYEAPTTMVMPDGKLCLMIDFFGCEKDKMGYVPFISESTEKPDFIPCPGKFSFPYGFKHGGIIEITDEEYKAVKENWR